MESSECSKCKMPKFWKCHVLISNTPDFNSSLSLFSWTQKIILYQVKVFDICWLSFSLVKYVLHRTTCWEHLISSCSINFGSKILARKLLVFIQILLVSAFGNFKKKVWRICTLILRCKRWLYHGQTCKPKKPRMGKNGDHVPQTCAVVIKPSGFEGCLTMFYPKMFYYCNYTAFVC